MGTRLNKVDPVRRINLTSQVIDSVKAYIVSNSLRPGAKLPSERELMARLRVSRNILREALKSLETVGLIQIRPGDGMYVTDFDYSNVVSHISFALSLTGQDLDEFIAARLVIEVGALDLIPDGVTDETIAAMEDSIRRLENATSVEQAAEEDLEFHRIVLGMAANRVLSEFGSFLGRFFMEAQHLVDVGAKSGTARGHRALLAALKKRDIESAKSIMREHILSWKVVRRALDQ